MKERTHTHTHITRTRVRVRSAYDPADDVHVSDTASPVRIQYNISARA